MFVRFCRPNVLTGSLPPKLFPEWAKCFVRVPEGRKRNQDIFAFVCVFFLGQIFPTSCPLV